MGVGRGVGSSGSGSPKKQPEALRLVSRSGCHLCDVMEATLREVLPGYHLDFETIDVDGDPELLRAYGDCVPVLLSGDRELARVRLSKARLERILRERDDNLNPSSA